MKLPPKLPWCIYPSAQETNNHGLILPEELPKVNFAAAAKYRSDTYRTTYLKTLRQDQLFETARIVAKSFAVNEPMHKHVHPPKAVPDDLTNYLYQDVFGRASFGPWTTENILYWFVRLLVLTNSSDPQDQIQPNKSTFDHSLAIVENDQVIGASFNIALPATDPPFRKGDAFLDAVFDYQTPIVDFFHQHEHIAIKSLCNTYADFAKALHANKVGYIFMIARSPELPSEHVFELFAASFEHFKNKGFEYMLITGTNNWTGAASEAMGCSRIYFAPYRDKKRLATEESANENEPYSKDGYLSAKDSGVMIYALKL